MNLFAENRLYEIVYRDIRFSYLQFIRIDTICNVSYVTWKNVRTGEMYTFEQSEMIAIRGMNGGYLAS